MFGNELRNLELSQIHILFKYMIVCFDLGATTTVEAFPPNLPAKISTIFPYHYEDFPNQLTPG